MTRYPSPLRYPGGKSRLSNFFTRLIDLNKLAGCDYVEPFAGGAGVGLNLLFSGLVNSIHLNDLDRSIFAFWFAVKNLNDDICELVESTPVTVSEWDRQKQIQSQKNDADLLQLAFSTLFLNRTNISGILRGGMIGGREQKGRWGIGCRFNKRQIIGRIRKIGELSDRIHVSSVDILSAGDIALGSGPNSLLYVDPPYVGKSARLYMNCFEDNDHRKLAQLIGTRDDLRAVITYDHCKVVLDMYEGFRKKFFNISHTASAYKIGKEVMLFTSNLRVPRYIAQTS